MKKTDLGYTCLDLFAGCGGLSTGFEMAGFRVVAANEYWEPAQESYKVNHPSTIFVPGDITKESTRQNIIESFDDAGCDVILGGPPCQAYSIAGLRDPDDPRGKLFTNYVDLVDALRPKIFVMENVKGILTMCYDREDLTPVEKSYLEDYRQLEKAESELCLLRKKSGNNPDKYKFGANERSRLKRIRKEKRNRKKEVKELREPVTHKIARSFEEIGYRIEYQVLNASHFGVAQDRDRVFFIGTRYPIAIRFPEPTHGDAQQTRFCETSLLPLVTVEEMIDDLKDAPEDVEFSQIYTSHSPEFREKIRKTAIGENVYGGYSDSFYRNPPDRPSRTVKENHGGVFVHYSRDRVMTPRELARLQSFPDSYIFKGSKSSILVQIGNAVPPLLGKAVGLAVIDMLNQIKDSEELEQHPKDMTTELEKDLIPTNLARL